MALQECSALWLLQHFPFIALKANDTDQYLAVDGDKVVREFRHGDSFLHCHTTSKELFHFSVVRELDHYKYECTIEDSKGMNLVFDPNCGTLVTRTFADTLGVGIPALYLWTVVMENSTCVSLCSNGRFLSHRTDMPCASVTSYDADTCLFEPYLKTAFKSMQNGKFVSASMMDSSIMANKLQANAWEMFLLQLSSSSKIVCYECTAWTVTGQSRMVMSASSEQGGGGSTFAIKYVPSRDSFVFQSDGRFVRVGNDGHLFADIDASAVDSDPPVECLFQLVPLPSTADVRSAEQGKTATPTVAQQYTGSGMAFQAVTPRIQCSPPFEKVKALQEVLDVIGSEKQGVILCEDLLMCDQLSDTLRLNGFASLAIHHAKSSAEQQWTLQQFESKAAQFLVISETFARKLLDRLPQPFVDALVFYNLPPTEEQVMALLPWTAEDCFFIIVATDEAESLRAVEGTLRQLNSRESLGNELSLLSTILSNSDNARKRTRVFGMPLPRDSGLPDEIAAVISYILQFGLSSEKLFLLGTEVSFVTSMRRRIDRGEALMLTPSGNDSAIAAALLQLYLKELPDALLSSVAANLSSMPREQRAAQVSWWKDSIRALYRGQQLLLKKVCELLEAIASHATVHKLSTEVLCKKFAPLMMGGAAQNSQTAPLAVEALCVLVGEHRTVFDALSQGSRPEPLLQPLGSSAAASSDLSVPGPPSHTGGEGSGGSSVGGGMPDMRNFFIPMAQSSPSSNLLNFPGRSSGSSGYELITPSTDHQFPDTPTAVPPLANATNGHSHVALPSVPLTAAPAMPISGLTPQQQQAMGMGVSLLAPFARQPSNGQSQSQSQQQLQQQQQQQQAPTSLMDPLPSAPLHMPNIAATQQQQQQQQMQQQRHVPLQQQMPLGLQMGLPGMPGNPLMPSHTPMAAGAPLAMPTVPQAPLAASVPLGMLPPTSFNTTQATGVQKEPWELDTSEVTLERKIGSGSFGEVWKGEWAGIEVAIKKISKAGISDKELKAFREEIEIMTKLRHPNILQFLGACLSPEFLLVTEYAENGSLYSLLQNRAVKISWAQALKLVVDVAKGILYLHSRTPVIVHRDIKSLNILVTKDWKAIVADFGLTKIKSVGYLKTYCGSPAWTAPEVLRGMQYDEMADVFSFGIVLWEILTRSAPYSGMEPSVIIGKVAFQQPGMRPPVPPQATGPFVDLMRRCWADDPRQRPNFSQILQILKTL